MAERRDLHLVTYDIRDPKRWRRAYRILRGYGNRVQYSVFRVRGTPVQIARLRWQLERILDAVDNRPRRDRRRCWLRRVDSLR